MFGPGSLLYESYGDRRGYLVGPVTGLLQLMYPALGRGVEQHSAFYGEPLERLFRSVPQIQGVIFDGPDAAQTASRVRDYHRDIKGAMPDGSRYHALDPQTFFWAHATFIDAAYRANDLFSLRPWTTEQKRAFYDEGVQWWHMYGLTARVVPPTYDDFVEYWDDTIANVLEPTPAARALLEFMQSADDMPQPWVPKPLWRIMGPTISQAWMQVGIGVMPPEVREVFGVKWTRTNQAAFETYRRAVATTWPLLPPQLRLTPRARAAYRRDGRVGLRTALHRSTPEVAA